MAGDACGSVPMRQRGSCADVRTKPEKRDTRTKRREEQLGGHWPETARRSKEASAAEMLGPAFTEWRGGMPELVKGGGVPDEPYPADDEAGNSVKFFFGQGKGGRGIAASPFSPVSGDFYEKERAGQRMPPGPARVTISPWPSASCWASASCCRTACRCGSTAPRREGPGAWCRAAWGSACNAVSTPRLCGGPCR